jgi:hypothetical protein
MGEGGMPEEVRREARARGRAAWFAPTGALDAALDAAAAVAHDAGLAAGRADERARVVALKAVIADAMAGRFGAVYEVADRLRAVIDPTYLERKAAVVAAVERGEAP